jgi:hypothetical protein
MIPINSRTEHDKLEDEIILAKNSEKTKKLPLQKSDENSKGYCHRAVNSRNVFRRPRGESSRSFWIFIKLGEHQLTKTKNGTALFLLF